MKLCTTESISSLVRSMRLSRGFVSLFDLWNIQKKDPERRLYCSVQIFILLIYTLSLLIYHCARAQCPVNCDKKAQLLSHLFIWKLKSHQNFNRFVNLWIETNVNLCVCVMLTRSYIEIDFKQIKIFWNQKSCLKWAKIFFYSFIYWHRLITDEIICVSKAV